MIDMSAVATKLSNARREKGFTQEELAVRLGVSSQAISKWERALSLPDIDLLLDVSKVLDISINHLLDTDAVSQEANGHDKSVYDVSRIDLLDSIRFDQILITIGSDIIPVFTNEYILEFSQVRRDCLTKRGVLLPYIRIRDDLTLDKMQCRIEILGKARYDHVFTEIGENINREVLSAIREIINTDLHLFVNRHMTKLLIENLKCSFPFCVDGVVPDRISLSKLKVILKSLVKSGHSISDLYTIIETLDDNIDDTDDVNTLVEIIGKAIDQR